MTIKPLLPIIQRALDHADRPAIVEPKGKFTYRDLLTASANVAATLTAEYGQLEQGRVAYLVPPGCIYAAVQWGVWRAGGVGVPMAPSHPARELAYILDDADPAAIIAHSSFQDTLERLATNRGVPVFTAEELMRHPDDGWRDPDDGVYDRGIML